MALCRVRLSKVLKGLQVVRFFAMLVLAIWDSESPIRTWLCKSNNSPIHLGAPNGGRVTRALEYRVTSMVECHLYHACACSICSTRTQHKVSWQRKQRIQQGNTFKTDPTHCFIIVCCIDSQHLRSISLASFATAFLQPSLSQPFHQLPKKVTAACMRCGHAATVYICFEAVVCARASLHQSLPRAIVT